MKIYDVSVSYKATATVTVIAKDEEEAEGKAEEHIHDKCGDITELEIDSVECSGHNFNEER